MRAWKRPGMTSESLECPSPQVTQEIALRQLDALVQRSLSLADGDDEAAKSSSLERLNEQIGPLVRFLRPPDTLTARRVPTAGGKSPQLDLSMRRAARAGQCGTRTFQLRLSLRTSLPPLHLRPSASRQSRPRSPPAPAPP